MMESLLDLIRPATSVRATTPGKFDPKHRSAAPPLFHTDGDLLPLVTALAIDEASLALGTALMTPGDIELHFLHGHDLLTSVIFIHPRWLRWTSWSADARLRDPASLVAWLSSHGWNPPPTYVAG
jgi:hypothetical protein